MKRLSLVLVAAAAGLAASAPAMAQQGRGQGSGVSPNREETVPVQLRAEQVAALQRKLNEQGFSAGRVDGLWGPDTSAAVRRFQQRNRLQATGHLDAPTLAALGLADSAVSVQATPVPGSGTAAVGAAGTGTAGTSPADAGASTASAGNAAGAQSGTHPAGAGASAGTSAGTGAPASINGNPAVAVGGAEARRPEPGANSFTMAEAQARIRRAGFQDVATLRKDATGVWRGTAAKDGRQVQVWLDYRGNVGQQ